MAAWEVMVSRAERVAGREDCVRDCATATLRVWGMVLGDMESYTM